MTPNGDTNSERPRDFSYTLAKMDSSLDVLPTAPGEIRERLLLAFLHALQVLNAEEDFPPDLAPDFQILIDLMTAAPAVGDEGLVQAGLTAMTTDDAVSVAKK